MKQITKNTLDKLLDMQLFNKVGKLQSDKVFTVSFPEDAALACEKIAYIDLKFEADNQLSEKLHSKVRDIYSSTWNENVIEIKVYVKEKISIHVVSLDLPEMVTKSVFKAAWGDLIGLGLEAEYSEYVKPGFFTGLSYWYDQGHFPCGWQGVYPQGKLMVY